MRIKPISGVLTLPRTAIPEQKIIQPLKDGNVKLTVAQTLAIRLGHRITATPSAHYGMSARRNRNSPPIKMRQPTMAEKAYAFMQVPKDANGKRKPPPENLRIVDVEEWDHRLYKQMSPWVRKKLKETYMVEK